MHLTIFQEARGKNAVANDVLPFTIGTSFSSSTIALHFSNIFFSFFASDHNRFGLRRAVRVYNFLRHLIVCDNAITSYHLHFVSSLSVIYWFWLHSCVAHIFLTLFRNIVCRYVPKFMRAEQSSTRRICILEFSLSYICISRCRAVAFFDGQKKSRNSLRSARL